jgi:hypothetical protein
MKGNREKGDHERKVVVVVVVVVVRVVIVVFLPEDYLLFAERWLARPVVPNSYAGGSTSCW